VYACVCSVRFVSFVPLLLCFNFCFLSCALSVDVSSFATNVIGAMLAKTLQSHKYALIVVMLERTYLQRSTCRKQEFYCSEWYAVL
jgi:hypothetical protein